VAPHQPRLDWQVRKKWQVERKIDDVGGRQIERKERYYLSLKGIQLHEEFPICTRLVCGGIIRFCKTTNEQWSRSPLKYRVLGPLINHSNYTAGYSLPFMFKPNWYQVNGNAPSQAVFPIVHYTCQREVSGQKFVEHPFVARPSMLVGLAVAEHGGGWADGGWESWSYMLNVEGWLNSAIREFW